jgi:hypothetical protein
VFQAQTALYLIKLASSTRVLLRSPSMHPDTPHDPCCPAASEELPERPEEVAARLETASLGGGTVPDCLRQQASLLAQYCLRVSEFLPGLSAGAPPEDPQAYAEAVDAFEKQRAALDGLLLGPTLDLKALAATLGHLETCAKEVILRMPWPGLREQQVRAITYVSVLRGGLRMFAAALPVVLAAEETFADGIRLALEGTSKLQPPEEEQPR